MVTKLTIKDFVGKGVNLTTAVKRWDLGFPKELTNGWSSKPPGSLEKPLIIMRKPDKHSNSFARLSFSHKLSVGALGDKPFSTKFREATLTIDETGRTGSLLKRTIYDFSDLEVIYFSVEGGVRESLERIEFDFAKASVFESSVENILRD